MIREHQISIKKTAKVYTLGNITTAKHVIVVLHGYGQLAKYFINKFKPLVDDDYYIIAPEGLSKFYLNGHSGRVGASWMTKEDRQIEINDQIEYLINNLSKEIKVWTNNIFTDSPNIVSFLSNITDQIKSNWDHVSRYESDLMEPELCFQTKSGSCRDLSWMMIQMLRSQSIPARFVSGYSYNPELVGHELHAWVEVWVNGAGWVAVDPSSGLFVDDSYVPIASSHHPSNTNPVHGKFRGDAIAELETTVNIHTS